ncbi:MAG: prkC 6 [Fibrobacteres bacterium]|nr:prkC 6 [Fibrobacterota bacterium]
MQCRECGASIAADISFCPTCGTRQVTPVQAARLKDPAQAGQAPAIRPQTKPLISQDPAPANVGGSPLAGQGVKTPKSALPQAGETFANRYRVEKYLGLGALCNSYLCRDLGAGNQEVVLKVMHARKAAEAGLADSFLFLAQSVAKYDHKGIAKIYDSGRHEGAPYYTMEWVGGVPLRLWLMERLNFENRVLPGLGIISSLLDTFEAIHERGCYGCVKPENVFITLNGPVITDFGVVGFLSPQEFEFNSYARRYLPYMAPELRQDWSNLLPHSDYYSIGAILYEILVGRAPAPQLRLPSELSRIFGIEADEIILKSMASRPLDRFGTVEAFKNAVVSLQSSLLNARPQEEIPGLPPSLNATMAPQAHSALEVSSDMQTIHNPDEAFSVSDFSRGVTPPPQPPGADAPAGGANPWIRENSPGRDEAESPGQDEGEKTLSAFARLGDRIVEEAHAQRRFAHSAPMIPGRSDGEVSPNAAPGAAWDGPQGESAVLAAVAPEEEASEPVPAWLWISLALAGSCMVVLSAYFGLLHPN